MQLEDSRQVAAPAHPAAAGWFGAAPTDFSFACAMCRSPEAFRQIVRGPIRRFLPHEGLIAALGLDEGDEFPVRRLIGIDVGPELVDERARRLHPSLEEMVAKWFKSREPLLHMPPRAPGAVSAAAARDTEVLLQTGRVAVHGEVDLYTRVWSYLIFTGVPAELSAGAVLHRLRLITPILGAPLTSLDAASVTGQMRIDELDAADRQLLQWIVEGCSNPEIARLRGVKLPVVRNQVVRLYARLGVKNRIEALRLASPICLGPADRAGISARQ